MFVIWLFPPLFSSGIKNCAALIFFFFSGKTFGTLFDVYIKMWHYTRKFRYFANCFVWGTSLKKRFNVCQSCIQINLNLLGIRVVTRLFISMSSVKFSMNLALKESSLKKLIMGYLKKKKLKKHVWMKTQMIKTLWIKISGLAHCPCFVAGELQRGL